MFILPILRNKLLCYTISGGQKMLIWLIISVIIGCIVAGVTGINFLFWVVAIGIFILGLPGALIGGFFHDREEYRQDRADYRAMMRDLHEDMREEEREMRRNERHERYLERLDRIESKRNRTTYKIDARSVHYHNHNDSEPRPRDEKGRFISKK